VEMTRQRVEESILSSLYVACPYCRGRGDVKSPLGMSVEIQRQIAAVIRRQKRSEPARSLQITVHPTVLERLRSEDEDLLVELQNRFEGSLGFRRDPARHVEYFSIADAETGEVLYATTDR